MVKRVSRGIVGLVLALVATFGIVVVCNNEAVAAQADAVLREDNHAEQEAVFTPFVFSHAEYIVMSSPLVNIDYHSYEFIQLSVGGAGQELYYGLGVEMIGGALFCADGDLLYLNSNSVMHDEYNLIINIGKMARSFRAVGYEVAAATDINGVSVRSFVIESQFNPVIFILATFYVDGLPHYVLIHSDQSRVSTDKERMNQTVNLLTARPPGFADLILNSQHTFQP